MLQRRIQGRMVAALERPHQPTVPPVGHYGGVGQEVVAENGCHRDCDQEGGQDAYDVGQSKGPQHSPLDPGQEEEREEDHSDDERRIDNGSLDLPDGVVHDRQTRTSLPVGELAVLPEATEGVLHGDDGVVHQGPDCDCHATQGHRVDGAAEEAQEDDRDSQRQRNCQDRDAGGSEVPQEEEEDHRDEHCAVPKGLDDVVHRQPDEVGLLEEVSLDAYAGRDLTLELIELFVNPRRELDGVHARLLLHSEDHGRRTVHRRHADAGPGPDPDLGHIRQAHGGPCTHRDHGLGDVLRRVSPAQAPNLDLHAVGEIHPSRGYGVRLLGGVHDLG